MRRSEALERDFGHDAYRVELERNHLVWVTSEGGLHEPALQRSSKR